MLKPLLLSLVAAVPAVASDCPPPLIPHAHIRETFDCLTVTSGTAVYDTRIVEPTYVDNRTCVGYYFFLEGDVSLTNPTDAPRTIRYHIEVPLPLVPFGPTELSSGMCYDFEEHELVLRFEALVEPGETIVIDFEEWADFSGWNPGGADLNQDYIVDGLDIALLQSFWGTSEELADLNADGVVDGADLAILLAAWPDSSSD